MLIENYFVPAVFIRPSIKGAVWQKKKKKKNVVCGEFN